MFEIWQSRSNKKYDKKLLPQQTIINKINTPLKTMLLTHYKKHKPHHTLHIFQEQFCIYKALAKVENNLLTIQL